MWSVAQVAQETLCCEISLEAPPPCILPFVFGCFQWVGGAPIPGFLYSFSPGFCTVLRHIPGLWRKTGLASRVINVWRVDILNHNHSNATWWENIKKVIKDIKKVVKPWSQAAGVPCDDFCFMDFMSTCIC